MGTVYRATHLALDHLVALKVIAPDLADDESFRERFKSESRIAVSLRHPNVVPIHHAGEEDGLLFVTMDLIEGPDLRKLLIARGPLEPEQAVAILEQVAAALDVAHSRGLVHRDIKPGNILIDDRAGSDRVFLTDFGLTKRMDQASAASGLTSTGAFVGTLDYVAPEQIRGDHLDARTDVYALGCVLYEMLTAKPPFGDREEKVAKMYAHLQDSPEPLDGENAVFNDVIARATAKQQDDRYPSAGDLARAAEAALEGTSVVTAERSVATGPAAPTTQHRTPAETIESPPPPLEPTAESEPPPPETLAGEAPEPDPGAEPEPTVVDEGDAAEAQAAAARRRREPARTRSRVPLLIGGGMLAGIVVAAVILISGGGDDGSSGGGGTTTTSKGSGAFDPKPLDGGVPGGELPVGVAADGNDVFVADRTGNKVILGDGASMSQTDELSLDSSPEDLVVSDGSLYVTIPDENRVLKLSESLEEEASIKLEDGSRPSGISVGEDGKIWVAGLGSGNVYEIPAGGAEAKTVQIGAQAPFGIAATDSNLWVVARESNEVLRADPTGDNAEPIPVGANPKGIAVANGAVYVANTDDGTVTVFDEDGTEIDTVQVGGLPRAVDVLGDHVWVSNGDEAANGGGNPDGWVTAFDAGTADIARKKIDVGGSPEGLGTSAGRVWVATGPKRQARAIEP